jgi:signal peptidase
MGAGTYARYALGGVVVVLLLALLLGQLLGQPLLLTYVQTDSMSPTIEPGDGYIVLPSSVTGGVSEGDIVLYEAQEFDGGGLTTHRVVGETDEGYITKGDNNPFTDQDGGEPPVQEGQVVGVALQVGGGPVTIPWLGVLVTTVRGLVTTVVGALLGIVGLEAAGGGAVGIVAIVAGLLMLLASVLLSGQRPSRSYDRRRGSFVLRGEVLTVLFVLAVLVPANASMVIPGGTAEYTVISSENPAEGEDAVQPGGTLELRYTVQNSGFVPLHAVVEPASSGVRVDQRQLSVPFQGSVSTGVALQIPEQSGTYARYVHEHRYLGILPGSWIATLHRVHPVVALGVINVVIAAVVAAVTLYTVGTGRVRLRSRAREESAGNRLRDALRRE